MPKRILAVDDEPDILMIVKSALQNEGFLVDTASNGPDAVAYAKETPPDLILLDVMMPGMSGFEVLSELKADDKTAMIPVVMLTGLSEKSKIQEAINSGTSYYIVKPFEFHDLITKVNEAMESVV